MEVDNPMLHIHSNKTKGKQSGFTLPELLITLGIVAILMTTAVPGVGSIVKNSKLSSQLSSIATDVNFARSEAVKSRVRVIMCRSSDPNSANPVCGGTAQTWTTGYLIFADDGNYANNIYNAATDTLLRRGQPSESGVGIHTNLTWNNNLEFNPDGTTNEGGSIAILSICDDRGQSFGRQIQVNPVGTARMYSSPISSCYP